MTTPSYILLEKKYIKVEEEENGWIDIGLWESDGATLRSQNCIWSQTRGNQFIMSITLRLFILVWLTHILCVVYCDWDSDLSIAHMGDMRTESVQIMEEACNPPFLPSQTVEISLQRIDAIHCRNNIFL